MENRWQPEFNSFANFLRETPGASNLRFWQALLAWAAISYESEFPSDIRLSMTNTFYWEWEGPHPIGPPRRQHVAE